MQSILKASRFLLPVAFLGYATVVNLGYARFPDRADLGDNLLSGGPTAKVESLYRQSLPHRESAIGAMGALRYLALGEGRKGVLTGKDGWLFTAEEVRPLTDDLDATLSRIDRIRDRLEQAGAQLVIVPVPGKLDVQVAHGDPATAQGIATLYDAFLAGLRERRIDTLDARAALRLDAEWRAAFFRTDTHWTPRGAEGVARALAGSGLVTRGDTDFAVRTAPETRFTGDLVSFITTDRFAPMLGLMPERATPYTAEATDSVTDIFAGTQAGATLLIGTSYSANPTFSFAEALKLALGRDVLNLAVEGQGPARPMLDYLASDDFRTAPPRVVIWEFPVRYLTDPALWGGPTKEKSGA